MEGKDGETQQNDIGLFMRLIFFNTFWTIIIDIIAWFIIHMAVVMVIIRIPVWHFDSGGFLYRPRTWEKGGDLYQRIFKVKKWKKLAPDGATLFKDRGFPKKRLKSADESYLHLFLMETCRAELAHWIIMGFAPFFFLWNRFFVGLIMILYALLENLPLIMVQRYNRHRLIRVLQKKRHRQAKS
jgi:glycosyl-4,4'-diaponeurosporenoate acyltransferase